MEKLTLDLPAMYADHHVMEVRRILLEMPGVGDVYASSCFHVAEIMYDPAQVSAAVITARLDQAGYLGDLVAPLETGAPVTSPETQASAFRHTASYPQTGRTIGFAQNVGRDAISSVSTTTRALWPCPGVETLKTTELSNAD